MTGTKRRFGIGRRPQGVQLGEDFAAVFAGDLASRPSVPLDLPVEAIEPSPFQARLHFDDLDELAAAIRVHGFTSRIRVRPHPAIPERYQLVFGERRLRAARAAGLRTVPAEVAEHSDEELREIGLTENLLRRDLSPLEEGRAFVAALDSGYSVRRLSERIGKASKGYVENRVAVARAPEDVQAMVRERPDTLSAARQIMQLPSERERRPVIAALIGGTLTSDDVAALVRGQRGGMPGVSSPEQEGSPLDRPAAQTAFAAEHDTSKPAVPDASVRRQRADMASQKQVEREIVEVLAIVGRWHARGPRSDNERTALGHGIAQILAQLDGLLRELEDASER